MQWLAQNWVWILFSGGMIAMHVFGMGCHAGHGKHNHSPGDAQGNKKQTLRRNRNLDHRTNIEAISRISFRGDTPF